MKCISLNTQMELVFFFQVEARYICATASDYLSPRKHILLRCHDSNKSFGRDGCNRRNTFSMDFIIGSVQQVRRYKSDVYAVLVYCFFSSRFPLKMCMTPTERIILG